MATETTVSTWLVTGASSGIGQSISIAALDAGHKVIGATRDVSKAETANPDFAAKAAVREEYDIDVLVNNAGYAFIGGVEDTSEEEVQDQLNVNFFGPLRAVRAILPAMRAKRRGHIVLISSGIVYMSVPGRGAYKASKSAIEAIHDSLRLEVEELGIKVLIVEPGAFRTPWTTNMKSPVAYESTNGLSEGYKGTAVELWVDPARVVKIVTLTNLVKGDPNKAAREIVKAVIEGHDYLRMVLGHDCVESVERKLGEIRQDLEATKAIAMSTDGDIPESVKGTTQNAGS
ncbi:hypothetical protein E0Z10_g8229 [Xylaria hypoxylon]|uniref:Uncharacterized protein n=1 Tax=Xylaria hypoxylon TaxID=37992 RepID=A0A4Z0Y8Q3_9PEZI|nr:hypothetical protein E0Z10_g8229 [Xylaria hypoxylon]